MKASVERLPFQKMIEQVIKASRTPGRPQRNLRLSACAARLFLEANGYTAGLEALVLEEGACQVHLKKLLKLLETYHPKEHVTLTTHDRVLQIERFQMPATQFSVEATPPAKFEVYPVYDAWLGSTTHPERTAEIPPRLNDRL